jgi:hypothetical protein
VIVLEVYCLAFSMLTGNRIKFQLTKCINQVPARFSSEVNSNSAQFVQSQTAYMDALNNAIKLHVQYKSS